MLKSDKVAVAVYCSAAGTGDGLFGTVMLNVTVEVAPVAAGVARLAISNAEVSGDFQQLPAAVPPDSLQAEVASLKDCGVSDVTSEVTVYAN